MKNANFLNACFLNPFKIRLENSMRLSRENTLIENNQFPCAGWIPKEIQEYFISILKPYETDILNIESALLLHNIPLFIFISCFIILFCLISNKLTQTIIPSAIYCIIFVPIFQCIICTSCIDIIRNRFYQPIPAFDSANPRRVRPLEEVVSYLWKPILCGWRIGFAVYRVFLCPNIFDSLAFVFVSIIIGIIFSYVNIFILTLLISVIVLAAPAIFTRTSAGDSLKQLMHDWQQGKETVNPQEPTKSEIQNDIQFSSSSTEPDLRPEISQDKIESENSPTKDNK